MIKSAKSLSWQQTALLNMPEEVLLQLVGKIRTVRGGYADTPLEEILPVDMEIKTQSENPDLAMIMVIDKSGRWM